MTQLVRDEARNSLAEYLRRVAHKATAQFSTSTPSNWMSQYVSSRFDCAANWVIQAVADWIAVGESKGLCDAAVQTDTHSILAGRRFWQLLTSIPSSLFGSRRKR